MEFDIKSLTREKLDEIKNELEKRLDNKNITSIIVKDNKLVIREEICDEKI